MRVLHGDPLDWDVGGRPHAVSIGVYDGVHRGHRRVLEQMRQTAAGAGLSTAVLTFDRHPLALVAPDRAPRLLTTLARRLELLEELGVEVTGVLPFAGGVRSLGPQEFVEAVLHGIFQARLVVVGEGFRFGLDRAGDTDTLASLGRSLGFGVEVVSLVDGDGPLSSTRIRRLLAEGEVAGAADALGRLFEVPGRVVRGDGRGARVGFPTANLEIPPGLVVPGKGVYAVWAIPALAGRQPAVANIGVRPTFGGGEETVEVHLLDYHGDLYGSQMLVGFVDRIRDELRFSGIGELAAQIRRDISAARRILGPRQRGS